MIIIWKRLGFLVPVLLPVALVISTLITEAIPQIYLYNITVTFSILAVMYWFLGRKLNKDNKKEVIDKETGETIVLDRSHSFFFIKMEYWSVPAVLLALIGLLA